MLSTIPQVNVHGLFIGRSCSTTDWKSTSPMYSKHGSLIYFVIRMFNIIPVFFAFSFLFYFFMERYLYFSRPMFLYILFLICLNEAGNEIVLRWNSQRVSYLTRFVFCYLHYVQKNRYILFLKSDGKLARLFRICTKKVTRKTKMLNWKGWFRLHHFSN